MSLTRELDRAGSPVREFFDQRLPTTRDVRRRFVQELADSVTVLPDSGGAPAAWSVLGHAVSARLLWELEPAGGAIGGESAMGLIQWCGAVEAVEAFTAAAQAGPQGLASLESARVAFIAGLLERELRIVVRDDDPWTGPIRRAWTWQGVLDAVPEWCAADVAAVAVGCEDVLLELAASPAVIAPRMGGAQLVGGADADLIVGSMLVDVKAKSRVELRIVDLRQLVGYALLDVEDRYRLDTVGILAARQGRLVRWPLDELLSEMAGEPVTAAEMRADLQLALVVD